MNRRVEVALARRVRAARCMHKLAAQALLLGLAFLLSACVGLEPDRASRHATLRAIADEAGWAVSTIPTSTFAITSLAAKSSSGTAAGATLAVYIEGDGLAWVTRARPATDPSPVTPIALQMAVQDKRHPAVAYLARPCQYNEEDLAKSEGCGEEYWTDSRFGEAAIRSMNEAVDALKQRFGAAKIALVAYSGGGTMALLLAQRRDDVVRVITVAGNPDPAKWAAHHRISPLLGSRNPAAAMDRLKKVEQYYLVGENDANSPPSLTREFAREFVERYPDARPPLVIVVPGYTHTQAWATEWSKELAALPFAESEPTRPSD